MNKAKKHQPACPLPDTDTLLQETTSEDAEVRARAVRAFCPCRAGWETFEQHITTVRQLCKDPSPLVRANALHVFEDAGEMESGGYPTNPREATNDMLRRKRQSRFRPDAEELEAASRKREAGRQERHTRYHRP